MAMRIRLMGAVRYLRTRSSPAVVAGETHTLTTTSCGCYNQETMMKKVKICTNRVRKTVTLFTVLGHRQTCFYLNFVF